jgi:hypothetical protein
MGLSMSEAVSTYRQLADWAQRIAKASDQKDADIIRAHARRLSEIADRLERQENEPCCEAWRSLQIGR